MRLISSLLIAIFIMAQSFPTYSDPIGGIECNEENLRKAIDRRDSYETMLPALNENRRIARQAAETASGNRFTRLLRGVGSIISKAVKLDAGGIVDATTGSMSDSIASGQLSQHAREDLMAMHNRVQPVQNSHAAAAKFVHDCEAQLSDDFGGGAGGRGMAENPDVRLDEDIGRGLEVCAIQDACIDIPDNHTPPDPVTDVTVEDGVSNEELCRDHGVNCDPPQ